MKRIALILLMAAASVTAFSQSQKAKHAEPITAVPTIHDLKIGDDDLNVLLPAAASGIHNFSLTTEIPAKNIPAFEARFQRFLEALAGQQYQWQQSDKVLADSLAKAKARQDSIIKAKPKK